MKLSLIVAMTQNGVIGYQNKLPWHLPADLKWFKAKTIGHPIIMGRNTFLSLPSPLTGRLNIVLTRTPPKNTEQVCYVESVEQALFACRQATEAFVIGGASVYPLFLPLVETLYITWIEQDFIGDAHFPIACLKEWKMIWEESHSPDFKNEIPYRFSSWVRACP